MDKKICYIKQQCVKSQSLRNSKEVETLRYLSLVVPLIKVGDEAVHKEWGDEMERAATTASSLEAEQDIEAQTKFEAASKQFNDPPLLRVNTLGCGEDSIKLKELIDLYTKMSEQHIRGWKDEITATIDGKIKTITKASIRSHLKLEDSDGITTLPNTKIFEQLALMGASKGFNGVDILLFPTMLVLGQIHQGVESTVPIESHQTPTNAPSTSQPPTSTPSMKPIHNAVEDATMPYDLPLLRVQSLGSTKLMYGAAYTKPILRVKKLEHKVKTSQHRRKARVVISGDEEDLEEPSKQGRKLLRLMETPLFHWYKIKELHGFKRILRFKRGLGCKNSLQEAIAEADSAHDIDWNDPPILRYHELQNSTLGTLTAGGSSSPHPDAFIPANTLLHVDQDDFQIPYLKDTAGLRSTGIFTSAYDDDLD
nr:hypothetical protein [Tanacetum cinerariifolium]